MSSIGSSRVGGPSGPEPHEDAPAPAAAPGAAPVPASAPAARAGALPDRNAVVAALGATGLLKAPGASLPEVLFQSPEATVEHGTDPGDFYCEHIFFTAQREAARAASSVVKNAAGEKLVGFLHVPPDDWTGGGGAKYAQADRHRATREVVGAALRGYFQDAAAAVRTDPVKVLLTGYGPFESVVDNPTGDFVSHTANIDAALKAAFGADLKTPVGKPVALPHGARALAYKVVDPATGRVRTLEVGLDRFAVADATLDPKSARSIERAVADFKPQAILSMGVAGPGAYLAEHHADDGGMRAAGGGFKHVDGAPEEHAFADNYSLARAILRGGANEAGAAGVT